jgi:hypothetical protein
VPHDKRRARTRCVALIIYGRGEAGEAQVWAPRVSLMSDKLHMGRQNKPGRAPCPSVTESEHPALIQKQISVAWPWFGQEMMGRKPT